MKKEIPPAFVAGAIVLTVILVGYLFYANTGNVGNLPYGAKGNPGPFAPGGAANGAMGGNAGKAKQGGSPLSMPNAR